MLKLLDSKISQSKGGAATFGWLCVETNADGLLVNEISRQPPSGGCVLKHNVGCQDNHSQVAATFGWLCVETARN